MTDEGAIAFDAMSPDPTRALLRHTLATLAYRGGKAVRGASPDFATYLAGPTTRTPGAILAHIGDLLDWGLAAANGRQEWHDSPLLSWDEGVTRFFLAIERFDARLADPAPLGAWEAQLFQGPIADAIWHVGQIALLRRMAGSPVRGENYFKADIAAGVVGRAQPPAVYEFD